MNKLKLLDLFSGIGGFSLGLESTGFFETIGFVEKDKFCHEILKKNFPNITIESEVRNVKGDRYAADIITGGFPCQPFSVAGKRRGTDDDRYLWDETIRIIRETKPRWFIGENVEGIINIQEGMVLRQVQDDLEKEGFQVQCLVIPASSIGAWHQRKRVWIIAHSNSNRNRNEITRSNAEEKEIQREYREKDSSSWKFIRTITNENVANSECLGFRQRSSKSKEFEGEEASDKFNNCDQGFTIGKPSSSMDVSNSNTEGLERHNSEQELSEQKLRLSTNQDDETRETWWQTQSRICGVPNGVSFELDKDRKDRIKSLGNSIVPLIARQLGLAIMKAELDEIR